EFDGDDDAWLEAAKDCGHHGDACACGH
ncbi:TPA: general secretion pathway protein GspG, partial [Neisseria gonorrhoeae]